jgi:hypothetical protein
MEIESMPEEIKTEEQRREYLALMEQLMRATQDLHCAHKELRLQIASNLESLKQEDQLRYMDLNYLCTE